MNAIRMIHFSDIHAGGSAEDCMAYLDKRWVGVFNYRWRRRFQHDLSLAKRFADYILKDPPDVLICTGDLTSTGQPGEFAKVLRTLRPLLHSSVPMLYVPGNHDCYVKRKKCVQAAERVFRLFNEKHQLELSTLPQKRTIAGIDFLLVNESWPSNLISSCGYLKAASRKFLTAECAAEKVRPRILVGHYPLIEMHPLLRIRHRLWGQCDILPALRDGTIDLSLCGHVHRPFTRLAPDGHGEICAGSLTRNGCFAEILYDPASHLFSSRHLQFRADGAIEPLYPENGGLYDSNS